MAPGDEDLLRQLYAGLEVVKSQQTEINRRLGNVEADQVSRAELEDIEAELEDSKGWWTWVIQQAGYIVMATILLAIGKLIGLEVAW
mgnify:CR=1 FL=1